MNPTQIITVITIIALFIMVCIIARCFFEAKAELELMRGYKTAAYIVSGRLKDIAKKSKNSNEVTDAFEAMICYIDEDTKQLKDIFYGD